jgi:vacuolar iron transporter family protein
MYEVEHMLNDEKKEIIDIYQEKGFSIDDCARIADLISTNKQAFVNIMMLEELGLVVIDDVLALKCGLATLISFMILGALPAIPYFISYGFTRSNAPQTIPVMIIGAIELFSLGVTKASMIGLNPIKSGLETLILGAVITAIGYGVGLAFHA